MLEALKNRLQQAIERIRGRAVVDKEAVKALVKEIQRALLMADVNVEKVLELSKAIEEKAMSEDIPAGLTRQEHVTKVVYDELTALLGGSAPKIEVVKSKTNVFMLVGIEGSGKTLTCAKIAHYFHQKGYKVGLISTDTYRPGAKEQLRLYASKVSVPFYEDESKRPEEIARRGVDDFKRRGLDIVIVDTAGRHKEEKSLLKEMREMAEKVKPDQLFLVIDGTIGQQAYPQAKAFHEVAAIGGIAVTKLDGSAKGGGALSAASATGAKVYFVGAGEDVGDLEAYDPARFVGRLLGLGDMQALLDKVREIEDFQRMKERMEKVARGRFTLLDLMEQVEAVGKMGSLSKLLDMIPGLGTKVPKAAVEEAEEKLNTWRHVLKSMTDDEKLHPELIKSKRVRRISRGAGVEERVVRDMVKQYFQARRMIKSKQGRQLLKMMKKKGMKPEDLLH
ncbi:MAG: signal recognition particle protein [Nitrososphaeria archaeon]|nr:signal recognition particle protein [Nitrososphaeria archaeon]NIN51889.1 signal recognition particle protein [Nitrososphaeria archaeon]NIQ32437.1 signal recognition particle protein [Nitrososphaeria archaeon]